MKKAVVELASIIKKSAQSAPTYEGFLIGKVLTPPPEVQIGIDEGIVLNRSHLFFSASVLNDYQREFEIEGDIDILENGYQPFKAKGKIKWTDTLKTDDLVLLVPAGNQQMYIVIEKAVEL